MLALLGNKIMPIMRAYFSGRLPFELTLDTDKDDFIRRLSEDGERMRNLPVGGVAQIDKSFLFQFESGDVVIKSNVPLLEHIWFLPGGVRFVGKILQLGDCHQLKGYFETSHNNNLNKIFFYTIIAVAIVWMARELYISDETLAAYFKVFIFGVVLVCVVPVIGWINMFCFQWRYIQLMKRWLCRLSGTSNS